MKTQFVQLLFIIIPAMGMSQMNSSFDFIIGLESSFRSLNNTSEDPIVLSLLQARNDRELKKSNWRIGFNYNKRLARKIILKSGLRLASVGHKDEKQTDLRWPSEIGPNGYMFDPSLPHELQLSYDNWFVEVPIAVRFELSDKKFSPFIELGVSPSVYVTTRFKSVTDIDSKTTTQRGFSDYNNVHFVGFGSVGSNYSINKNYQLFGQAIYRYHVTKLVDAPIEEYLYNYGFELGIRRSI